MAQDTFATMWNRVLLFAPDLPPYIAQEFTKQVHDTIVDYHNWSELKVDDEFTTKDWYTTGTVAWTQGSADIVGTDTLWDTGTNVDQYSQIQLGNLGNYFTIITITDDTHITLDRTVPYETASGESYHIGQLYTELPTDVKTLEVVRDKDDAWKVLKDYYNQEWLDRIDPNRTSSGTPTVFVYANNRIDSSGNSIPRWELWPPPSSAQSYSYRYTKKSALSAATDRGLEIVDSDAYLYGALSLAAMWPGTRDKPNPFFNMEIHKSYNQQFLTSLQAAEMRDHERDQRMVLYELQGEERLAPIDAKYIQSHGLL